DGDPRPRLGVDVVGRGGGVWPGTRLGELDGVEDLGLDLVIDGLELGLACERLREEELQKPLDRTAGLPELDLLAGPVGVVAHALSVGASAIRLALDQRRAATAAGTRHGLAGGLGDGQDIVAVDLGPGKSVGRRPAGDPGVAAGIAERDLGGE